jgi:RNA polymerase sigma factor (sigma-70 family)
VIIGIFHTTTGLSDEKLMERYRSTGNSWFLGELYKRYSHPVSAMCYYYFRNTEDAEDTAMEIFEILMIDLKKHEIQNFKPWLHSVVRHYCLRKLDKSRKPDARYQEMKKSGDHFMELSSELSLDFMNGEIPPDLEDELKKAIESLKDDQRICVELFFIHERSYQDIADETGYPINKVKSHIQNGKRNLKIFLENQHG